ncbi:MAG TPA: hypothetical protein VGR26_05825 [Acidimicrobiales bacterium]|nr:hypothetical protein [Acidimicrobiales bacterium]
MTASPASSNSDAWRWRRSCKAGLDPNLPAQPVPGLADAVGRERLAGPGRSFEHQVGRLWRDSSAGPTLDGTGLGALDNERLLDSRTARRISTRISPPGFIRWPVSRWFTTPQADLVVEDEPVSPTGWLAAGGPPDTAAALAEAIDQR